MEVSVIYPQKPQGRPAADDLLVRWQRLRKEQPGLRIRQASQQLGVSELALVRTRPANQHRPLKPEFPKMMQAMAGLGPVMILTRNDQAVHEVTASFGKFTVGSSGTMGLAVGDMDVRVFFRNWVYGYLVEEEVASGLRQSLQFFDRYGAAVHKVYKVAETRSGAWAALVERFSATAEPEFEDMGSRPALVRTIPETIDTEALRQSWAELKDIHHFGAMLKKHQVDRLTALEQVGEAWAVRLPAVQAEENSWLDILLADLKARHCPAMFFVGNPGIVQIFTGRVDRLRRTGPWMNVLDPGFSLHVNTEEITGWWVVRRPSVDSIITSVEAFNRQGELVLTVFGKRKPGEPESSEWQVVVASLEAR